MPLMEASGTKVERMRPDRLNIWIAPVRNCDSMSVSPPSWLLGNTWISTRPPDCSRMRVDRLAQPDIHRMLRDVVVGVAPGELGRVAAPGQDAECGYAGGRGGAGMEEAYGG